MEKKMHKSFLEKGKINLFYTNKKPASENVEILDNGDSDAYSAYSKNLYKSISLMNRKRP
jgi:thymidine kinase